MGKKLTKLKPVGGFCARRWRNYFICGNRFGYPVCTTQTMMAISLLAWALTKSKWYTLGLQETLSALILSATALMYDYRCVYLSLLIF